MEENPEITVTNQSLDGTNYDQLLNTMLLGGSVPDVFMISGSSNMIPDLVKNGYIQPLDGIEGVEKQTNEDINELLSYDGKVYGFALNGGVGDPFVYYNKKFFEANNLQIPTNLEEFDQLLAEIAALGETPLAASPGDLWSAMYPTREMFFSNVFELEMTAPHNAERALLTGEVKLSDIYREPFEKLAEYVEKDYIAKDTLSMGWEQATQYLVDGGAQMLVSGNWVTTSAPVADADPEQFELGVFPLLEGKHSDGKYHANASIDRVLVLSANSKNPEAAKKLFEYFIDEEHLKDYCESQGLTGMNIQTSSDPALDYTNEFFAQDDVALNFGAMAKMPAGYNANVNQYAADIFTGSDVEELLARVDADYDSAMSTVDVQEYIDAIDEMNAE